MCKCARTYCFTQVRTYCFLAYVRTYSRAYVRSTYCFTQVRTYCFTQVLSILLRKLVHTLSPLQLKATALPDQIPLQFLRRFKAKNGSQRKKNVIPIVDVDKWTWRQTSCMSPQKGKAFALHVHCTCKCPLCTACPRYLLRVAFVCWLSRKKHSRTYVRAYSPRTALAEEPELWLLVQAFTARSHALTHAHRLTVARKAEVVGAAVLQCRGCFKRPPE